MTSETLVSFHLPTKPFTAVDFINRRAAATGSMGYASACSDADYNGHAAHLSWNSYRGYYVGAYHWAERVVIVRSASAVDAVQACVEWFKRSGRGASLSVSVKPEDADAVRALGVLVEGVEPKALPFWTWKHEEVGNALWMDKHFGAGYVAALIQATDAEDYKRRCEELRPALRAAVGTLLEGSRA